MITTTFRQATVNFYSFEEWVQMEEWGLSLALGYYSEKDNQIHVLKDMKALREAALNDEDGYLDCYRNIPDWYVRCILHHEYIHFLQWKLGRGKDPLPILPSSKVPLKVLTRKVYQKEDWLVEAEAHYLERRPELLEELEAIVEASMLNKEEEEVDTIPSPPFDHFQLGNWKVEDLKGQVWVWSPTWGRWELEDLYDDYE